MQKRLDATEGGAAPHDRSGEASRRDRATEFHVPDDVARDLAIVVQELENFLDPDVIPDWLLTRQYALGDRTPIEALRDGHLPEVLQAVNATEHGAYI